MGNLKINGQLIVNENIIDDFIIDYYPKTQEEKILQMAIGGNSIKVEDWNRVEDI